MDYIRHRARPEWGIGQVLLKSDDRIEVQFAHGLVLMKLSVAGPLLEPVSTAEARAAGVAATTTRRSGPAKTASAARRAPRAKKVVEPEPDEAEADEAEE